MVPQLPQSLSLSWPLIPWGLSQQDHLVSSFSSRGVASPREGRGFYSTSLKSKLGF